MSRTPGARERRAWVFQGGINLGSSVLMFVGAGAPTSGTSGTGVGEAGPGSFYIRTSNGAVYTNTNTKASPTWTSVAVLASLTDGHILVGDGSNAAADVAMTGDVTIDNTGATAIGAGKVTPAMLSNTVIDGLGALRVARATFNPSATSGERTVAAHGLGVTIPDKSIVVGGVVQVNTLFDSADHTGSLALSLQGANDIVSVAAISGAPWSSTGLKAIVPKANTPESTGIALTAAREITATVTTTALTVGKLTVFLYYLAGA